MTNGLRIVVETLFDGKARVRFEHELRGTVALVDADTLTEAIENAISQFKEMQDAAIDECMKYGLVKLQTVPAKPAGEMS